MSEAGLISDRERARAILNQALAEARSRGTSRVVSLQLVLYDPAEGAEQKLRQLMEELASGTAAEGAQVQVRKGPTRFMCYICCGLRFESEDRDAVCPNCGHVAMRIPVDVTFGLDGIEAE